MIFLVSQKVVSFIYDTDSSLSIYTASVSISYQLSRLQYLLPYDNLY